MERRLVLRYTTLLINCHRQTNGDNAVCRSTGNLAYRRILPLILQEFRKYNKEQIMRVSGKRQGIDNWSNGWLFLTDFQRRKSKCRIFLKWSKQRQQLNSFHLLRIVSFLQKRGGGNKAWTILIRQRTTSCPTNLTSYFVIFAVD